MCVCVCMYVGKCSESNESIYSFVGVKSSWERKRKGKREREKERKKESLIHLLSSCICIFNFVRATFLLPTNHLREFTWPLCVCFSTSGHRERERERERERKRETHTHKVPYAIPWVPVSNFIVEMAATDYCA